MEKNTVSENDIISAIRQVGDDKAVIDAFRSISESDFRMLLDAQRTKRHAGKSVKNWLYSTLALAAVLAGVIFLPNLLKTDSAYNQVFAQYYETPKMEFLASRGGGETSRVLMEFKALYNSGRYKQARQYLAQNIDNAALMQQQELCFYSAITDLETDHLADAQAKLENLYAQNPDWGEGDACWYLAMAYLKGNQQGKAKTLLSKISNGTYADRAAAVLKALP